MSDLFLSSNLSRPPQGRHLRLGRHYCGLRFSGPAGVFQEVFRRKGVEISMAQAREPMGMHKSETTYAP